MSKNKLVKNKSRVSLTKKKKKLKVRKLNRYNSFQRALSHYLKSNNIKSKSKFYEISKVIYSKIEQKVSVKGFPDYIELLYNKNFKSYYDVEIAKSLEEIPFFEVGRIFVNEFIMFDYNISASFNDMIGDDGANVFIPSMPPDDFLSEFASSGLKSYLRNNYNDSPTAVFKLVHFDVDTKTLQYDIEIDASKVGDIHYVPFDGSPVILDKFERTSRAKLEKSVKKEDKSESAPSALTGEEQIALEKAKDKRMKTQLKLIKELRKLGYSTEEIRKQLGDI